MGEERCPCNAMHGVKCVKLGSHFLGFDNIFLGRHFNVGWGIVATLLKVHEYGARWCAIQVIGPGTNLSSKNFNPAECAMKERTFGFDNYTFKNILKLRWKLEPQENMTFK